MISVGSVTDVVYIVSCSGVETSVVAVVSVFSVIVVVISVGSVTDVVYVVSGSGVETSVVAVVSVDSESSEMKL